MNEIRAVRDKALAFCVRLFLSFCAVIGVAYHYFSGEDTVRQSTLNIAFLICFFMLFGRANRVGARIKKHSAIFGFIYAAAMTFGKSVYDTHDFAALWQTPNDALVTLASIVGFTAVAGSLAALLGERLEKPVSRDRKMTFLPAKLGGRRLFFVLWAIIFVAYMPCLMAYYPGVYSYDMPAQTMQALSIVPYNKFHPPLHTLLWQICLGIEGATHMPALTVYAVIQAAALSAFFASCSAYIGRRRGYDGLFALSVLFFALNPVFAIFSIIPTKDVIFAVFFGFAMIRIYDAVNRSEEFFGSPRKMISAALCITLACLFRNNAIYVFVLCVPFFVIFLKGYRRRIAAVFGCAIVLFGVINGPVMKAFKVSDGDNREKLCVPMQQIAKIVVRHGDELDSETVRRIDLYLDYDSLCDKYNPRFADPVKNTFKTRYYDGHKADFVKLWLGLVAKYPGDAITAFADLNLPYMYPDADTVDRYSKRMYIETRIVSDDNYPAKRESKLPHLYEFYEDIASYGTIGEIPIVANLFSISTPLWAILLCGFCILAKRDARGLLVLLPPLLLLGTYLLGPVSNFRYVFPLITLYPLLVMSAAQSPETK